MAAERCTTLQALYILEVLSEAFQCFSLWQPDVSGILTFRYAGWRCFFLLLKWTLSDQFMELLEHLMASDGSCDVSHLFPQAEVSGNS